MNQPLNLTLALQVTNSNPSERTVNLHPVNQSRLRNHLESRHLLKDSIVSGTVEDDHVLGLFDATTTKTKKEIMLAMRSKL